MRTVHLLIPCLIDQLYPEMGVALVKLLRFLEVEVQYDPKITCCGQPAFNAGQLSEARAVAASTVERISKGAPTSPVVCPSGSCTAMMRNFYPELFHGEKMEPLAVGVAGRAFELSEYLEKEGLLERLRGTLRKKVAFHNSCHSARELGLRKNHIDLFKHIDGLELIEPSREPVCCGFGGLFCQKFEDISKGMAKSRLEMCLNAGAELIVSNDPGCIMHLRVKADELGICMPIMHTTQILVEAMGLQ